MPDNYDKKFDNIENVDVSDWSFELGVIEVANKNDIASRIISGFVECIELSARLKEKRNSPLELSVELGFSDFISKPNPSVNFNVSSEIEYCILDYTETAESIEFYEDAVELKKELIETKKELLRLVEKIDLAIRGGK